MISRTTRAELPPDLAQKFDSLGQSGLAAIRERNFLEARVQFKYLYETLLNGQPNGESYHKGFPLHNWAIATLLARDPQESLRLFILAFVEDALSQEPSKESDARDTPAGQVVWLLYKVDPKLLTTIEQLSKNRKPDTIPTDPQELLDEALANTGLTLSKVAQKTPKLAPRDINNLESSWEKRVFIGGNYSSQFAFIQEIALEVSRWGFDPIIASEFTMPTQLIHHHTMMLLHNCKLAIFDISAEAGQLMEIERLRDYELKPLLVYSPNPARPEPRVSSMLSTLMEQGQYDVKPYSNVEQLRDHVKAYLEPYFERVEVPPA